MRKKTTNKNVEVTNEPKLVLNKMFLNELEVYDKYLALLKTTIEYRMAVSELIADPDNTTKEDRSIHGTYLLTIKNDMDIPTLGTITKDNRLHIDYIEYLCIYMSKGLIDIANDVRKAIKDYKIVPHDDPDVVRLVKNYRSVMLLLLQARLELHKHSTRDILRIHGFMELNSYLEIVDDTLSSIFWHFKNLALLPEEKPVYFYTHTFTTKQLREEITRLSKLVNDPKVN